MTDNKGDVNGFSLRDDLECLSFEQGLTRLQEVVRSMETEELSLSDSVKYFREAMGLVKLCQERLNEAQGSIEEIMVDSDGGGSKGN